MKQIHYSSHLFVVRKNKNNNGSGLGLAIVSECVKQLKRLCEMAISRIWRQYSSRLSKKGSKMKYIALSIMLFLLSGCATTEHNVEQTKQFIGPVKTETSARFVPLTEVIKALVSQCAQKHNVTFNQYYKGAQHLQGFIHTYCGTDSTTKQLKAIEALRLQDYWPEDYNIWFESLAWHTQNLREQKNQQLLR